MVDNSGGGDFGPGAGQSGMGTRPDRHFGHHCKLAKLGQIGHYCHSRLQWIACGPRQLPNLGPDDFHMHKIFVFKKITIFEIMILRMFRILHATDFVSNRLHVTSVQY